MQRKKPNENKYKDQPVWRGTARLLRLFFKKPRIVSLSGDIPDKAIYVANHAAMFGPLMYNLYLPAAVSQWGAYPMLGGWKQRYRYLKDVYFIQKRHKSKFAATVLAFLEAGFAPMFYKGLKVLPSYNDRRFIITMRKSFKTLDEGRGLIIFPEKSEEGYLETLTGFYGGFVVLAKYYRKLRGEDVPIYPIYYHPKYKKIVIGFPVYYGDCEAQGMDRNRIAEELCDRVNELFEQHIKE